MAQNLGGGYPPPGTPVGNNAELHHCPQQQYPQQSSQQFPHPYHQQNPQLLPPQYILLPPNLPQFSEQHPEQPQQNPQHFQQYLQQSQQNSQHFQQNPEQPRQNPQHFQLYPQQPQQNLQQPQQYPQQFPSPYGDQQKHLKLNIQEGANVPREIYIPCYVHEFFQWTFCLLNNDCLELLRSSLSSAGIGINLLEHKAPVFMYHSLCDPNPLVYYLRETSQRLEIICEFFSWDLSTSEEDLKVFCTKFVKNQWLQGVLLFWEKEQRRTGVCLVGHKTAFDLWRPFVVAEIQREQKGISPEPEPFRDDKKVGIIETKIFHVMKTKLETEFQVQISVESDDIKITAITQGASEKVFKRVKEMCKGCRIIELPFEFCTFLLRQEKAKLYVENEIEKLYKLEVHFLVVEKEDVSHLLAFEENNREMGGIEMSVSNMLFLIPSEDTFCQLVFSTENGKTLFANIVKENEGKLSMIMDERKQFCCVGTKDIEEKVKKSLVASLVTQEYVELPSEEVWNFCKKHWQFEDMKKNLLCEVKLAKVMKFPWAIEICGPIANVSHCHRQIAEEIRKIDTKPIDLNYFINGSEADMIKKWNEEKRCFVNLRSGILKISVPWKKWIESRGSGRSLTYSISFDTISVTEADLRITLLPEEQGGATSKDDFQYLGADWVQVFVPPMSDTKKKDTISRKITSILNFNSEHMGRRNILVDCEHLQEKELRYCMKLICHTLNERVGKDLDISKCEFYDTRQEMFACMTRVIDTHLNNKNVNVLEWKGRNINMDVQEGQLAHQQDFDVLVNSTSADLELKAGFVSRKIFEMAGPEIQTECKKKYRSGIRVGKIAVTGGYNLKCKFVFHGCMYKYDSAYPAEPLKSVRIFVRNCLETADSMKMESIAFPALGTGQLGYNRKDIANIIFEEVEKYEKEVKIGSLNRVCCVIFQGDIDSITEFQKRHSIWKTDHKKEICQELVVTTDSPKVLEEICQEAFNLKNTKLTEPPNSEITEKERLGETTTLEGAEKNVHRNQVQESGKKSDSLLEERRCLLLKIKEPNKQSSLVLELRKDFRDLAENIVYPFHSDNQALLQFTSEEGIEKIYQMESLRKKYDLQRLPQQAVVDLKAVVSQKMVKLLKERGVTADLIRQKSGVTVDQKEPSTMVLCGNILEIKAAFDFLTTLLKKPLDTFEPQSSTEDNQFKTDMEKSVAETDHLKQTSDVGKLIKEEASTAAEQLQQFEKSSLKLSQVSFTSSMTTSTRSVSQKDDRVKESTTVEMHQLSEAEKKWKSPYIECTNEDYIKLKHFHRYTLNNVKENWSPQRTIVTMLFANEDDKEEVKKMLQKISQMSRKTLAVQSKLEYLDEILKQKCSDDLFCHLTKGNDEIEIIGSNRRKVEETEKELIELFAPKCDQEEEEEENAIPLPVFLTNEGISVFVYQGSLPTVKVDAIVCPISKKFDLHSGLPNIIAEMAGPRYKKEVDEIRQRHGGKLSEDFVCIIPGGQIPSCKYVVNVVTDKWKPVESKKCKQSLQLKMLQICLEAEKKELQSIALPAICSGKTGYPREICANCYASSIVKYSSVADFDKGLKEIHFVDQSKEMITYIESVFTNPDMIEEFGVQEHTDIKSSESQSSLYPYMDEDNTCCLNENLKISVKNKDISKLESENGTLVYDESLSLGSKVKKAITKLTVGISKGKNKQQGDHGDIGEIHLVDDASGRFKYNLHVILPVWNNSMKSQEEQKTFFKRLSLGYAKIFEETEKLSLFHLILPLYGAVEGNVAITKGSASCFIKELRIFANRCKSFQKKRFSIIMANKDQLTNEIILKELKDVVDSEQAGFQLSVPKSHRRKPPGRAERWKYGDQPHGTMCTKHHDYALSTFGKCGTIELIVTIPNGRQQSFHPKPGNHFIGRKESIFLPDNRLGREIVGLFMKAFQQRILYTVNTSRTSNVEMVVPTDIPVESRKRQNPDYEYLQTLLKSLKSKIRI